MYANELLLGFDDQLGKLCIFGCKKQKAANRATAAAAVADKVQAEVIETQKQASATIAVQNAQSISDAEAKTKKTTMMIVGAGAAVGVVLLIIYVAKKK